MNSKEHFKRLLGKIGSGESTSRGMTRAESAEALKLILKESASPTQIGAFLMAHRIRRPEPQELAGMLDTYLALGPQLSSSKNQVRPICFGMPFDGRCRTAPIFPLTSLVLLSTDNSIVLNGGRRMPIKYGVTPIELFSALGLCLEGLNIKAVQTGFHKNNFALMIKYRDELGKRPPIASMELLWTAHKGDHLIVSGFVHPPTETRAWKTLQMLGERNLISIKGLEGSIDLPISRSCITSYIQNGNFERLILHPKKHFLQGKETEWKNIDTWKEQALKALDNEGPLVPALTWNSGAYLWLAGKAKSLDEGLKTAKETIGSGAAMEILKKLISWRAETST